MMAVQTAIQMYLACVATWYFKAFAKELIMQQRLHQRTLQSLQIRSQLVGYKDDTLESKLESESFE